MTDVTIDQIRRSERGETERMLARAFHDSPLMAHCIPDDRKRLRLLRSFFKASVRDALPFSTVWVARDGGLVVGAAVWLPPEGYPPGTWRQLRQAATSFSLFPMAPRSVGPSLRYLRASERVHPKDTHWYLAVLGVEPSAQGRGIGGRLIAPVLQRADTEGLPAYLETDKERNLAFYARARFELVETLHPDGSDAPPLWTMWRDPKEP